MTTKKLNNTDLDRMLADAKAATPGPWAWELDDFGCVIIHGPQSDKSADTQHIANMDPDTTLALIAALREAQTEIERLKSADVWVVVGCVEHERSTLIGVFDVEETACEFANQNACGTGNGYDWVEVEQWTINGSDAVDSWETE